MATITAAAGGGAWQTNASWVGGVRPTAADDVLLTAASGNITIDSGAVCRSLNCTGFTGTLTHTAGVTLTIGDATAGASNVALLLVAGMTYTLGNAATSALSFISTSVTQQTVTFAGKTTGAMTFSGAGGSWLFADAASVGTAGAGGNVTLTAGTLNTGGQTCSWAGFSSSGSLARTLTLGASAVALTSTNGWSMSTSTNLTLTSNTAVVTTAVTGATITIANGFNTNGLSVVFSGAGVQNWAGASSTIANLTRTGTAAKTDTLSLNGSPIVTGTVTLTGNSATNRILVFGSVLGTATTITAAAVSLTNVDFMDITGAGAASPFTGTSLGDCQGNSGITFTTAAAQTWQGTSGGNWSDSAKWTSRVPLPQDDVSIASAFTASQTVTADMPRLGKSITWAGSTGTPTWSFASTANSIYGSVTLISGMTISGTQGLTLAGRGASTLTSAGKTYTQAITVAAPSGSYTLADAFVTSGAITHTDGTFADAGFGVTATTLTSTSGRTRVLTLSGTWSLTSTAAVTIWNVTAGSLTLTASAATFAITGASASSRTFAGAGQTYGTITYTVANSPGALVFTGANTITNLNIGSGRQVTFPSSTTTTVTNWNVAGAVNGYVYLPGVAGEYASAPDSAALSITGDIDIRMRFAPTAVTGTQILLSKDQGASQVSYNLYLSAANPRLVLSTDGTSTPQATSSADLTTGAGGLVWLRVTWRQSDGRTQFFTASGALANPVAADFAQLGTNQTLALASIFDSTTALAIGQRSVGSASPTAGKFYRVQIRNGIDGTVVFDADFTTKAFGANTFVESSTNAATVTINGATAQAGDGRVEIASSTSGTAATLSKSSGAVASDYLRIKDSTATGGAAWYAGANSVNVSGNTGWIFTGYSASGSLATTTATANAGVPTILINGSLATTAATGNAGSVSLSGTGALATTTSTAGAGSSSVSLNGALATTTATAGTGSPAVSASGSLATTTDTALAGGFSIGVGGSLATSANTANAGAATVLIDGAQALSTETAWSGASTVSAAGSQATSTENAWSGTFALSALGNLATETDTAWSGGSLLALDGALATETATAFVGAFLFGVLGGQAISVETAWGGTPGTRQSVPGSTRVTSSVASTRASSSSPRTTASAS